MRQQARHIGQRRETRGNTTHHTYSIRTHLHINAAKRKRQEEEEGDAMKALENKTLDSKIEMDILEALDEIR